MERRRGNKREEEEGRGEAKRSVLDLQIRISVFLNSMTSIMRSCNVVTLFKILKSSFIS